MTMTPEQLEQVDNAVELIRPEATEYLQTLSEISVPTTKDNYGEVMSFLSMLSKDAAGHMAPLFLIALVEEGYPADTADQLVSVMGWGSPIRELVARAA